MKNKHIKGILIINKPKNITSNKTLIILKKKFNLKKLGHCGTLDPLATGVLIILLEKATQNVNKNQKKHIYIAQTITNIKSLTNDIDGKILFFEKKIYRHKKIYIRNFIKYKNTQHISMYSAIKHSSIQLYKYAKLEVFVNTKKNNIKIFKINVINKTKNTFTLFIKCLKGTYIRCIIKEIEKKKNIPLCLINLNRIFNSNYSILKAYNLKQIVNLKNISDLKNILH